MNACGYFDLNSASGLKIRNEVDLFGFDMYSDFEGRSTEFLDVQKILGFLEY